MQSQSSISRTVMRRVHTIHAVRPLFSGTVAAGVVFLIALWSIGREVWVAHVLQNLEQAVLSGHLASYLTAAFLNTGFIVQVLSILTFAAAVWLVRDAARSLQFRFA